MPQGWNYPSCAGERGDKCAVIEFFGMRKRCENTKRRENFCMVFDISHGFRVNNVKTNLGMISVFGTAEISVVPFLLGAIGMFLCL